MTEIYGFDFDSLAQVAVIHAPAGGEGRTEKTYTDHEMLEHLNATLDFIPDGCRVDLRRASGWTEIMILSDANGASFSLRRSGTGMRAGSFLYIDCGESMYSEIRKTLLDR